ncbi:MAG: hybrid sensor histidine kinase/response regulator [Agarilytica sp.]
MNESLWESQQIANERVKGLIGQGYMSTFSSWAAASIFIFVPNAAVPAEHRYAWYAVLSFSCLVRIAIIWAFKRAQSTTERFHLWGYAYTAAIASTAIVWCSALFLLTAPGQHEYVLVVMLILVALCIGASHASTTYLPAGQAYSLPALAAITVYSINAATPLLYGVAVLGLVFLVMIFFIGLQSHRHFEEIQRLRFDYAKQKEDAEKANIAKSKFLAAASHDLRQPMHALVLFTSVLKEKVSDPLLLKTVDNIGASVDALQGLFNALLDISKLDASIIDIEPTDISLRELFEPIEKEFRAESENKGIDLFIQQNQYRVHTDPQLLGRILRNLLSNAIRYTEHGSVTVTFHKANGYVDIQVKDTGPGIAEEHQHIIFNEFTQLHNPERDREKGLGLGLAIVKRLATLLDYNIEVQSELGQGASFNLCVPVAKERPASKTTHIPEPQPLPTSLQGFRVILVDDEAAIRAGIETLLSSWGCEIECFESSAHCCDFLQKTDFKPQAILSDYRLQNNKTGLQLVNDVQQLMKAKIPSAIITGDTAPDRLMEAKKEGHLLLHKPVQPMQIRSFLMRVKSGVNLPGSAPTFAQS